jgi:hypothetical protein
MKIPSKIKVLGKTVTVKLVHPTEIDTTADWDSEWYTIRIKNLDDPKYPEEKKEEGFLHEIIEAINDLCDLNINHYPLTTLSECLYQVMKDNKINFGG